MSSPNAEALLADLARLEPGRGSHTCHTGRAIGQLPDDVAAAVNAALDNPIYSSTDLCNLLNKHQPIALTTANLARHRRRGTPTGCKCPREATS